MIRTVIFDLDGTLIDTEPTAAKVIDECLREWGIRPAPEDATYITGRTWQSAFDYLFAKYPLPIAKEFAAKTIMDRYKERLEHELIQVPGAVRFVKALAERENIELGLVSGSTRLGILWALDQLKIRALFKVILGAEDYPQSKPAPDGFKKAGQLLGANAAQTLVFEDSQAGIAAAIAAGFRVVAVTATNHFQQDTSKAHDRIVDFSEIDADWVQKF